MRQAIIGAAFLLLTTATAAHADGDEPQRRPAALPGLYAASAFLHSFDTYSTLTANRRGLRESNPIVRPFLGNPGAFIGMKAGTAIFSITAAEWMWKRGHRREAVLTMIVTDGMMAFVAQRNSRALTRTR